MSTTSGEPAGGGGGRKAGGPEGEEGTPEVGEKPERASTGTWPPACVGNSELPGLSQGVTLAAVS